MLRFARLVAVAIGLFLCAGHALAQSVTLDAALRAYGEGRLDEALGAFERALAAPGNGPDALATIYRHLGILRASLGDAAGARSAFELALALAPDTEAPRELGPGQRAAFDEALAAREGRTMRVEARAHGRGSVEARVVDAPVGLVAGIVVGARLANGAAWTGQIAGDAGAATLPNGARDVTVQAVDEHGGVVARAEVALAPAVPAAREVARRDAVDSRAGAQAHERTGSGAREPRRDDDGGGFFSTAWPWIGLGVIVVGGAVAAILLATAQDEYVVGAPVIR